MPTYDYRCEKCGHAFEVRMSLAEHEKKPRSPCPKCKARQVEQLPSRFQAVTSKKT